MYIHNALHPLVKASWEGDKRALTYFKSPRADNQDVFQSLNTHCSLRLHITKKVWNCQNTNLSLRGREFQTKGSQNQELLTWQISNQGFPRRNLSKDTKEQTAPSFLPLPILQDNPSPIQQQTSKWGSTSTSSSKQFPINFAGNKPVLRSHLSFPLKM